MIGAALLIAGLGGVKYEQFQDMFAAAEAMETPPEVVNVAKVREESWRPRVSSVGSVVAVQGTMLSTEAEGVVREIHFDAGSTVTAGQLLLQLDVEVEQAELRASEASAELALQSYRRAKELVESSNISKQEYDAAAGALKEAMARVENLRAVIAKKALRAPFAGQVGIRQVSVGTFMQKGTPVVSLQALDPVYVEFSLPQQHLSGLHDGQKVVVKTDAYPDKEFEGKLSAIDPDIDVATRNVKVQATFPNPENLLRPGMFVSVEVLSDSSQDVLLIPETAVLHAPYGDSVFVVDEAEAKSKDDETTKTLVVQQEFVKLGHRQGDFVVVKDGLKLGQEIVSTGVFKLSPGTTVTIDNSMAPDFKLNPKPENT